MQQKSMEKLVSSLNQMKMSLITWFEESFWGAFPQKHQWTRQIGSLFPLNSIGNDGTCNLGWFWETHSRSGKQTLHTHYKTGLLWTISVLFSGTNIKTLLLSFCFSSIMRLDLRMFRYSCWKTRQKHWQNIRVISASQTLDRWIHDDSETHRTF